MYTQNKHRKTYTPTFKLQIVNYYLAGEKTAEMLSHEFDLNRRMLLRWISKYQEGGELALQDGRGRHGKHAGGRPATKELSEIEQLRQENLRLKGENFLLKKWQDYLKRHKS